MAKKTSQQTYKKSSLQNLLKKHKHLRWLLPLLLLSYLLILFLSTTYSSTLQQTNYQQVTIPTPDPTADWKTYSNQKYGYSVKYPATLISDEFETSYAQNVKFSLGRDASGNAYLGDFIVTVAKEDFQAKDPASVGFLSADWTNSFYAMNIGDTKTFNTITFKKLPGKKVAGQNAVVLEIIVVEGSQKRYLLKHNGYVYMLGGLSNGANFQNILSTFEFIK